MSEPSGLPMNRSVRLLSGSHLIDTCIDSTSVFQTETVFALYGYIFRYPSPRPYVSYISLRAIHEVKNVHPYPRKHFRVLQRDIPNEQPIDLLIGFIHRHPPGFVLPSTDDLAGITRGMVGVVWCEGSTQWYDRRGTLELIDLNR